MAATPLYDHVKHAYCSVHDPCDDNDAERCPKEPARKRRKAYRQFEWAQLVMRSEVGGLRHYLDGEPVHCGQALQLQHRGQRNDDYGTFSVPLQEGTMVRYEASQHGGKIDATLHVDIGDNEFVSVLEPWMRFRWPKGAR
jgi:hypothetical protein